MTMSNSPAPKPPHVPEGLAVYAIKRIKLLDTAADILTKNQFDDAMVMLDEQTTGCGFRAVIATSCEEAAAMLRADILDHYAGVSWFVPQAFGFDVTFATISGDRFWLPDGLLIGGTQLCVPDVKE